MMTWNSSHKRKRERGRLGKGEREGERETDVQPTFLVTPIITNNPQVTPKTSPFIMYTHSLHYLRLS